MKLARCVALAAVLLIVSSCTSVPVSVERTPSSPTADAIARGGTLRVAIASELATLDPWTATDADTAAVLRQVYEPLVDVEPGTLRIVPRLATRWAVSPDARTWTFTLRSAVRFQDGTPFDASAVVFNFDRARAFARFDVGALIETVTAGDPSTVVFTLRQDFAPFLATLATTAFGMVSPACVRQGPAWALPGTRCSAGTGPFKIDAGGWKPGDRVALTRNTGYWGTDPSGRRLPYLDGVTFIPVRDEGVRVGALKAANIDAVLDLAPATVRTLRADPNIAAAPSQPFATIFLGIGSAQPLGSAAVRRALAMTVDRGAVIQATYAGQARPAAQLLPPGLLGYDDTIAQFAATDVAAAKKALADAGIAPGFATELWYSPDASSALPDPKRVADSLAADIAKLGIAVTVRTEDASTFVVDARSGRLPLWIGVRDPGRADPDDFMADATTDPVALELLRRARAEPDASKRGELYKQVTKLVQQSVSRIPLLHVGGLAGISKKVRGFVPATVGAEALESVFFGS